MVKKVMKVAVIVLVAGGFVCWAFPGLLMIPLYLFGGYGGLRTDSPLLEAHQRAVSSFVESEGFGVSRMRHQSHWNDRFVKLEGQTFDPEMIQLIGLTEEYGDRYFEDPTPPKKEGLVNHVWRETTAEEDEAIYELRRGAAMSRRISLLSDRDTDGEGFRVMAPIVAEAQCLECHDVDKGELIGAFAYTLTPRFMAGDAVLEEGISDLPQAEAPEIKADPSAIPRPDRGL